MYAMDELQTHWVNERITTEQAIGQILQHVSAIYERLREVERRVNSLTTTTATAPSQSTTNTEVRR